MNPEQLWETAMDPKTRTLKQAIEDGIEAEEIFSILMGDADPRREFIREHAHEVVNIDI